MNPSKPYRIKQCVFESTLGCNLRCRHCGSRAGKARDDELTTAEATHLFKELRALGCQRLTISGGEPMLRRDWPELIHNASRIGMRVGMITNGIAFDRDAARLARDMGLRAVGFSLDGPRTVHDKIRGKVGHFQRICQAMDNAAGVNLPFAIVTFVNSYNFQHLDEMHELIRDRGAFAWQIQLGANMGNMQDHQDLLVRDWQLPALHKKLASMIKKDDLRIEVGDCIGYFGPEEKILRKTAHGKSFGGCGAGIRVIGIESNGNVKGCLSIMPGYSRDGESYVEGNIRHQSLEEIWFKEGAFAYNRNWSPENMSGFCRECKHLDRCRGGCQSNLLTCGQKGENPMCIYRVLCKQESSAGNPKTAAAVLLAAALGSQVAACDATDDPGGDAGQDASSTTDTEEGTGTDSMTLKYAIPDIDTEQDTENVDYYGMPDIDTE